MAFIFIFILNINIIEMFLLIFLYAKLWD